MWTLNERRAAAAAGEIVYCGGGGGATCDHLRRIFVLVSPKLPLLKQLEATVERKADTCTLTRASVRPFYRSFIFIFLVLFELNKFCGHIMYVLLIKR